jgi:RimJ/RimL family protein N-acetyltransferase
MPITTNSYIRRAERDDLDTVVAWMEEPDFQRFLYGDPARSPKQIREQIVSMLGRAPGNVMPPGIYLMIDSPEEGPIGIISLQNLSWRNRSCNIDLYIGQKNLRNRQVTAISIYRAFEYCFDELNLHRVGAVIYGFNTPSWRIFAWAGAVREVTLKDHVQRDGVFHDVYVYGLLRHEFDALREKYSHHDKTFSLRAMIEALEAEKES